jgi:hypothetical protein
MALGNSASRTKILAEDVIHRLEKLLIWTPEELLLSSHRELGEARLMAE